MTVMRGFSSTISGLTVIIIALHSGRFPKAANAGAGPVVRLFQLRKPGLRISTPPAGRRGPDPGRIRKHKRVRQSELTRPPTGELAIGHLGEHGRRLRGIGDNADAQMMEITITTAARRCWPGQPHCTYRLSVLFA